MRNDFLESAADVGGGGDVVHVGELTVQVNVAHLAVKEAKTDGSAVVDGLELGEAMRGDGIGVEPGKPV
jgi:hypothetical protein